MKAFFTTLMMAILIPSNAWGAICTFGSDYDSTTCKIPLCALRPGGYTVGECYPPFAIMAWRAYWGQNPIPGPWTNECYCNWIPPLLIPTDANGIPITSSIPGISKSGDASSLFTPKKYAQIMVFEDKKKDDSLDTPVMTDESEPALNYSPMNKVDMNASALDILGKQSDYQSNCNKNTFDRKRKSSSCYIATAETRTTISMKHSRYGKRRKRRDRYDYSIITRSNTGATPTLETKMTFKHKSMTYCQRFQNGVAVTNQNCSIDNLFNAVRTPPSLVDPTVPDGPLEPMYPVGEPTQPNVNIQ